MEPPRVLPSDSSLDVLLPAPAWALEKAGRCRKESSDLRMPVTPTPYVYFYTLLRLWLSGVSSGVVRVCVPWQQVVLGVGHEVMEEGLATCKLFI